MNTQWISYNYLEAQTPERRSFLRCNFIYYPGQQTIHRVSANAYYTLYINESWVSRGPARTNQGYRAYDTVDFAPYLYPGSNSIKVLLYHPGVVTFIDPSDQPAGFWLDGEIIRSDASWEGTRANGYLPTTTRCTVQLGFQEHFDANYQNTENYTPVTVFESPLILENSGIPVLQANIVKPVTIVSSSAGNLADWSDASNITAFYCQENRQWRQYHDTDNAICYDFGSEVYGHVVLNIPDQTTGTLDILAAESVTNLTPDIIPPERARAAICFGHRVILSGRKFCHELTMPMGFRYLILIGRPVKITGLDFFVREQIYPLQVSGQFAASDAKLNSIWQISTTTQRKCMADVYMDCPWREQTQWWGDARIQAQNTFCLANDTRLFERGLRQIKRTYAADNLTYAFSPATKNASVIPGFSLSWVASHYDHYFQTGSRELFQENKQRITEVLDYFARHTAPNGLQYRDQRFWLFTDWCPDLPSPDAPTALNLQYLESLKLTAELSGQTIYHERATKLEQALDTILYAQDKQLLYDGINLDNNLHQTMSPHNAALAIIAGYRPQQHHFWAKEILLPLIKGELKAHLQPSSYFMYYVFTALKRLGYGAEVLTCIRNWWGDIVDQGFTTTPESWLIPEKRGEWSCCHAWSAHPLVHLTELVLGIKSIAPGWRKVQFAPLTSAVAAASGVVPTIFGDISVAWESEHWSISAPAEITVVDKSGAVITEVKTKSLRKIYIHL